MTAPFLYIFFYTSYKTAQKKTHLLEISKFHLGNTSFLYDFTY